MSVPSPSETTVKPRPTGVFYSSFAFLLEIFIELMVRVTGRRIRKSDAPWLHCYLGTPGLIGTGVYQRIAQEERLQLRNSPNAGLITDFEVLRGPSFDPDAVHPRIRHFYEHAAEYQMEVWSEVYLVGRFFLWVLVEFLSRRMDQLNFPISSLEVAKGMASEVIQLIEPASGQLLYTGWLRRLKSSGRVIYAGVYSTVRVPGRKSMCQSHISVSWERKRLFAPCSAPRQLVWSRFLRVYLRKIWLLSRRGVRARSLASAKFSFAPRTFPCLRR